MPCPAPQSAASIVLRDAYLRGAALLAVAVCLGSVLSACSGDEPLTEPEGGMHAFAVTYAEAVTAGNSGPLYQTISDANHERLARALVELRDMETLLQRLQPSERDVYREQAGLPFAATLETPADLLAHLLSRAQLPTGERVIRGLAVDEVQPTDDPNVVTVVTIADETYSLHRGEDNIWRVHSPVDEWIERSLADLQQSQTNLAGIVDMFGSGTDELDELRRLGFLAPEEGEADP